MARSRVDLPRFLAATSEFLTKERAAEVAQAQARIDGPPPPGSVLAKLRLVETHAGPGGSTAVILAPPESASDDQSTELGREIIAVGDVVQIAPRKASAATKFRLTGVVTRVTRAGLTVAVGGGDALPSRPSDGNGKSSDGGSREAKGSKGSKADSNDNDGSEGLENLTAGSGMLRVDKVANDVTYKRMRWALTKLQSRFSETGVHGVVDVLFHNAPVPPRASLTPSDGKGYHISPEAAARLNESQRRAAMAALNADRLAVIWGPPGTGKTTLLVEVIMACVRERRDKVLATAPSNIAVDTLAERLVARYPRLRVVRLGHPARLLPSVVDLALDARVSAEFSGIGLDIRKEMDGIHRQLRSTRTPRSEKYKLRGLLWKLQKELRVRESDTTRMILHQADVILATCAGSGERSLNCLESFNTVIVDEAAQALEPTAWIPGGLGERLVLVGDNKQLPPTVLTKDAPPTLFDRARALTKDQATFMLDTQYRMNAKISDWASGQMYEGKLKSHESVRDHLLCHLDGVTETAETTKPLVFIDTAGCDFEEAMEESTADRDASYCNTEEAATVVKHVKLLQAAGLSPKQIAVISPYAGQVRLLRRLLAAEREIEVDTVDGFQGREQESILISLVRSNEDSEVGFLKDNRRLNVAVTRAKRHVCVVGDSCTVSSDSFIQKFIDWVDKHGDYRSAWDYTT